MKKKLLLFLVILSFGIIITYPSFPISYNLISYCDICNGYRNVAFNFLSNGRVLNFIFYTVFNVIDLPSYSLGFISALLANIFLALSVTILYNFVIKNLKFDNEKYKFLIIVSLFLIYYNPLITSVFLLDEAFIICLGIMLLTLSAIKIYSKGISNYILSLVFAILGILCYQRIFSYFFVILLVIAIFTKENNIKKTLLGLLNCMIAFTTNFIFISLISKEAIKFNLLKNIQIIFTRLLPDSLKYYFGFMNNGLYIYYFVCVISLILLFIILIKNENKFKNFLLFVGILISSIIIPFVPNLFMNSSTNYIDALMCLTIDIFPICIVLILINVKTNKINIFFYIIILILYGFVSFYSIHQNLMIDIKRYQTDTIYVNDIKTNIEKYELENNQTIKTVYYIIDKNISSYYPYGFSNGANINILNVPWAFECALKNITEKKYRIEKLDTSNYKKYINDYDDSFEGLQYGFNNNTAYVLIDR